MLGYTHSGIVLGSGRVAWSPDRPEMGYHVVLGGRALAEVDDVAPLIGIVHELGGHITRCDVARDDRTGALDMATVREACELGNFTSRFKGHSILQETKHTTAGPVAGGVTVYFGSRVSDCFVRFYDKRQERIAAGDDDPGPWLRLEYEFKRDKADKVARLIVAQSWDTLAGIMLGYITFRDPVESDSNRRRWPVAAWWSEFMAGVAKVTGFFAQETKRTLGDVVAWLRNQVAPSIALLLAATGGDLGEITELAREGRTRWKAQHRALLAAA